MNPTLNSQLAYEPMVVGTLAASPVVVVGGMGGSALPALMLRHLNVPAYLVIHRGYGLPDPVPAGASYVAISHSGNTEETLSFAREALDAGKPLSVIASGGALLELAKEHGLPHVVIPSGAQPRDSILAVAKALLALIGQPVTLEISASDASDAEHAGEEISRALKGTVPVFYASGRNEALAYIAKILCNETAKTPAFSNLFPELNHNEMQGFSMLAGDRAEPFMPVFLVDSTDDPRIQRRMELTEALMREQGIETLRVELPDTGRAHSLLHGWWLLRTLAQELARIYDVVPDEVPLIEAFKKAL